MHIRRISMAKYPYPFIQGNYYTYPICIRENCGYPQHIYPQIHIRASLEKTISATVNNHIGHRKTVLLFSINIQNLSI